MIVFILLLAFYAIASFTPLKRAPALAEPQDRRAWALGLTLIFAGALHFARPATFVAMMPPAIPWHLPLVFLSGALEIAIGAALLTRRFRRPAAWAAVLLLFAVFPANIYAAVSGVDVPHYTSSSFYRWLRLPMQGVLIVWALTLRGSHRPSK